MKAGIGSASITLPTVSSSRPSSPVNAVGDVIDPTTGMVVAGVRTEDGKRLADARVLLRRLSHRASASSGRQHDDRGGRDQRASDESRSQPRGADGRRWASRARSIRRTHWPTATRCSRSPPRRWQGQADVTIIGALAAEALSEAIVRAALRRDRFGGGLPSARISAPSRA